MNLIELISAHASSPEQRKTLEEWAKVAYNTLWLDGSPRREAAERAVYEQCISKIRAIEHEAAKLSDYDHRRDALARSALEWRQIAITIEQHSRKHQELMVEAARHVY